MIQQSVQGCFNKLELEDILDVTTRAFPTVHYNHPLEDIIKSDIIAGNLPKFQSYKVIIHCSSY